MSIRAKNEKLTNRIRELFEEYQSRYDYYRITLQLNHERIIVNARMLIKWTDVMHPSTV
ncbi:IS3 family transposase [Fructobacillus tropaeoli]|uniref:IS3 family transposase n=1 Tax=Lactobacillaceae TaxID=33958 RepID=UPI003BA9B6FA